MAMEENSEKLVDDHNNEPIKSEDSDDIVENERSNDTLIGENLVAAYDAIRKGIKKDFNPENQHQIEHWLFLKNYFQLLPVELQDIILKFYIFSLIEEGQCRKQIKHKLDELSLISRVFYLIVQKFPQDQELAKRLCFKRFHKKIRKSDELVRDAFYYISGVEEEEDSTVWYKKGPEDFCDIERYLSEGGDVNITHNYEDLYLGEEHTLLMAAADREEYQL